MSMRLIETLRSTVALAVLLLACSACSNSTDEQAQATSPDDFPKSAPQDDTSGYGPKIDILPVAELLTGFDSFLDRKQGLIDATVFLVKKYDPGLCYGMPSAVHDSLVAAVVAGSPRFSAFIRTTFAVESDFQVFTKLRQLLMTKVREQSDGIYEYYLQDGRCCDILRFHGQLELRENTFFDRQLNRSIENVPC